MTDAPALRIEGLTVGTAQRTLLTDVSLAVAPGEIVLIAGPSGGGKSVFLKLVSGLIHGRTPGFTVTGRIEVLGEEVLSRPDAGLGTVGLVFQDFALFDGMTAARNVAFAIDHRRPALTKSEGRALRSELIGGLGLPEQAPVRSLSGGQRQRVAIARAMAFDPKILAYDEPTSGLDPAMRDRVAERIRETGHTTLVVTHDLRGLIGIADRILLLDPKAASLVEVSRENAPDRLQALEVEIPPRRPAPSPFRHPVKALLAFFAATSRAFESLGIALLHLLPRWPSVRWGFRFLWMYLKAVAGPGALVYFFMSGVVIGVVATYFTFNFLPYRQFTEPLILDDMVAALGFGLHRILVPLLLTILLAARAGAAVSADISTRVVGRQTDAMRTLGARPSRYLLTGVLWAFLIGTPIISLLAYVGAQAASACVFAVMAPDQSLHAWSAMFGKFLVEPDALFLKGTDWVVAKVLIAAFGIAVVSYFKGAEPKDSPEDVARAITSTVIRATAFCLVVHMVFALIEF
jgi:ABC-type multidrug transport system ATPase subunit/ABC-type transporter Mla maintaining outer membrane lipid asymmetry permease subunit MlaE